MIIPTMPREVVDKNGDMHPNFRNFLTQLLAPLQKNLSDEGYVIPELTTDEISKISGDVSKKKIVYNSTTGKMMLSNNGTFQTINVT